MQKEVYKTFIEIATRAAQELGLNIVDSGILTGNDYDALQLGRFIQTTAQDVIIRPPWNRVMGTDPWVKDADGSFKHEIEFDLDTPLIDAQILAQGAIWKYKMGKGLSYKEDFNSFNRRINYFGVEQNHEQVVDMKIPTFSEYSSSLRGFHWWN